MNSMSTPDPLMTIGRFAEITLLSQKALRLYDDKGLLRPARVDPANGYRLYSSEQAPIGRLISLLRAAGMPLDQVADVVRDSTPGEALASIDSFAASLHSAAVNGSILLDRARRHFTEDTMPDISTAFTDDQFVLTELIYPRIEHLDDEIRGAIERMTAVATERGLAFQGPAFGIFHGPVDEDSAGPLEVCVPVDGMTGPADGIRSYRLTGVSTAEITVSGEETDFPAILAAYDQVCGWVERSGHRAAGPSREIWHVLPWESGETLMTVARPYAVTGS